MHYMRFNATRLVGYFYIGHKYLWCLSKFFKRSELKSAAKYFKKSEVKCCELQLTRSARFAQFANQLNFGFPIVKTPQINSWCFDNNFHSYVKHFKIKNNPYNSTYLLKKPRKTPKRQLNIASYGNWAHVKRARNEIETQTKTRKRGKCNPAVTSEC